MNTRLHKNFEKQYKKLKSSEKERFKQKIKVFLADEFDPFLNNHPLKGKYQGYRSINITGDLRAIYKRENRERIIFVAIDSHSKFYD